MKLTWAHLFIILLLRSSHFYAFTIGRRRTAQSRQHRPPAASSVVDSTASSQTGFYVHIPYCRRRCRYCDFAIVPIGPHAKNDGFLQMDLNYRQALLKEISSLSPRKPLDSIYFGGGTPSLAPVETIEAILNSIGNHFALSPDIEITMEIDPGTFDLEQLQALHNMGINRISLGVQTLVSDQVLETIGRAHRLNDVYAAMDMIRTVYGEEEMNVSVDLISGLPGVSLAEWAECLERCVKTLKPNHVSIYDLQIESGTVFGKWYNDSSEGSSNSSLPLPSPDDSAYMYRYASGFMRHKGFEHYEISSYALRGRRSRHNQVYWGYGDTRWYAIGLGSTSFVNHERIARPRAMADYIKWVNEEKSQLKNTEAANDADATMDRLTEIIMTRLRTSDGLDLSWLKRHHSIDIYKAVLKGAKLGMELGMADHQDETLRLLDPSGFLFSNSILSSIFYELDELN